MHPKKGRDGVQEKEGWGCALEGRRNELEGGKSEREARGKERRKEACLVLGATLQRQQRMRKRLRQWERKRRGNLQ